MALTLYLNGVATDWRNGTMAINDAIEERSSASFTIVDTAETNTVTKGTPVVIEDDGVIVFSGVVDTTSRRAVVTPDGAGIFITCLCVDNHWYADKRVVAEGFTNTTAGDVAKQLVRDVLREENIYDHPYPGHAVALARTDLLGYWRLAADSTDDSYRGEDGTDVGTPTYVNTAGASPVGDDNLGGYVDLDGTGDLIATGLTPTELENNVTDGFTIAGWLWLDSGVVDWSIAWAMADSNSPGANNDAIFLCRVQSDTAGQELEFIVQDLDGNIRVATAPSAFPLGQWVHVVCVADEANGEIRLYQDGVEVAISTTLTGVDFTAATSQMVIGDRLATGDGGDNWDGRISEVEIVGRAFTDDEVALLYAQSGETSRISDGPTLTALALNYQPVSEGLEELAELSGFDFFIDPYRTLHLHGRGAACCSLPITLDDSVILSMDAELTTEAPKYRNTQFVKGGQDRTTQQVEIQDGDGDKRSFLTGFAIVEEPTVEVDRGSGFVAETVGIRGVETGVDWFWSKGDFGVVQDSSGTVLASTDQVKITYTGQFPIVAISRDVDEQTAVRAIEKAGTGWVEAVIEDASVDSRNAAFDVASSKLERFAQRGNTVRFTTRSTGLKPGQTGTLTFSRLGFSQEILIDMVTLTDATGVDVRYQVSAVTGPVLQSWQQFFAKPAKRLVVPTERVNIGAEEIATILVPASDTITRTEGGSPVTVAACVLLDGTPPTLGFTLC